MKILCLILIVISILSSCTDSPLPYELPNNATTLITDNSSKTWKLAKRINNGNRMNMGDCFLSYRQTYHVDTTLTDNNGDHPDCGESLHATWEIVKDEEGHSFIKMTSPQIPQLLNIEDDHKQFKLLHLSQDKMKVAYYHKQFSERVTTIIDYLVFEGIEVADRDFHW